MKQVHWSWFDLAWPWVGLGAAAGLFFFLFTTDKLRQNLDVSRWRDPVWLSWLAPAAYMIHQFEEYGIDAHVTWIAGLVCGLLSRRHPFVGLGVYAIHFTNSLTHLGVALVSGIYNSGALTAALMQLPLSLWVAYACFIRGSMRRLGMAILVLAGTLLSIILIGSVNLFAKGYLSATTLVIIQVVNPLCIVIVPWLFEKRVLRLER
jgi:hypothetical protein